LPGTLLVIQCLLYTALHLIEIIRMYPRIPGFAPRSHFFGCIAKYFLKTFPPVHAVIYDIVFPCNGFGGVADEVQLFLTLLVQVHNQDLVDYIAYLVYEVLYFPDVVQHWYAGRTPVTLLIP